MEILRTPDDRFADLPDFGWEPKYVEIDGMRMAYLDEGSGETVLCLHGEPTWSFLYRKMIPVFLEAGMRVVAPDWFGFGRSDKPAADADYTWDFHHSSMLRFVESLGLEDVTLVVQDWGGLLGLTLPVSHPDLVKRLLIMNTGLGVGTKPTEGFLAWRDYVANNPEFNVGELMSRAEPGLTPAEVAAYQAPFPDTSYMAGPRRFPMLVPITEDADGVEVSRAAAMWWATEFSGESFMAIGVNDPVLGEPVMNMMHKIIKGCPEPMRVEAGHFVQEHGEPIARAALQAWGLLP
ncbi:MAG: alpha/beta fold hydrolase [Actinobacteria bacterium]|nr:alpha/beta fold hydrolase [Actinomycetota bacterium]MCB8997784.1 alpha/beta fold hydrolase [Actinomycetota bacterium]MCB9424066.1 alpha/beta fold hydrolase [Actinomycetota bacterium]HRY09065.1 haloalkane dehalogenase [Candidatus Nanopelagicales bacterium]